MEFRGEARYAGTDWSQHNAASMWTLLEQQRTENHWRQVSAWRKTYELTSAHMSRLLAYRDRLAAVWPPEKSPAAAAYLSRLDQLIAHVRQTYEVATANYTTLAATIGALDTARSKMKKIHDEYVAMQRANQMHERAIAELPEDHVGRLTAKPPVSEAEFEKVNIRARSIMFDLSHTLLEAKAQIKQPTRYVPRTQLDGGDDYGFGGTPPVIPPITAIPTPAGPPITARPPATPAPVTPPTGTGPVLGGAAPVIGPAPVTPPGPNLVPSGPPSNVIGSPMVPPTPGLAGPLALGPSGKPSAGAIPRAVPPGGVIGGPPAAGFGQSQTAPSRRVNPVGGVINGQPVGGMLPAQPNQSMGSGARRQRDEYGRRWDPDNPWETEQGVEPVVRPPRPDGRFDPGTTIGFAR